MDKVKEDEVLTREMFAALDVYELSNELWGELGDYIKTLFTEHQANFFNLSSRLITHDTKPSVLETFTPAFFRTYPMANAVVVLFFTLKTHSDDPDKLTEGGLLLLDNNRKAYAFTPKNGKPNHGRGTRPS